MGAELTTLASVGEEDGAFLLYRCRDCGRRLGRYGLSTLVHHHNHLSRFPVLADLTKRSAPRPGYALRTGTGLYLEREDGEHRGRLYVRLRCKCGRNQKLKLSTLADLEVVAERGERVVYL